MVAIGNFFGSFLGYLLWIFYQIFKNYGVAIILFTVVLKIVMFPFSINQQKSMAANTKLSAKQKELQKKYGNDRIKMNEEMQKLYEKEGYNPASGCLPMLIPFPIMIGLYYTVINPLSNALHLGKEAVTQAVSILQTVPGISGSFTYQNGFYNEMEIVRHFSVLRPYLTMFTDDELSKIQFRLQLFGAEPSRHSHRHLGYQLFWEARIHVPDQSVADSRFVPCLLYRNSDNYNPFTARDATAAAGLYEVDAVRLAGHFCRVCHVRPRGGGLLLDYFYPHQPDSGAFGSCVFQPGIPYRKGGGAACCAAGAGGSGKRAAAVASSPVFCGKIRFAGEPEGRAACGEKRIRPEKEERKIHRWPRQLPWEEKIAVF